MTVGMTAVMHNIICCFLSHKNDKTNEHYFVPFLSTCLGAPVAFWTKKRELLIQFSLLHKFTHNKLIRYTFTKKSGYKNVIVLVQMSSIYYAIY